MSQPRTAPPLRKPTVRGLSGTLWTRARPRRFSARYSRLVGFLRYALPALAVALLLVVVLWPKFYGGMESFRLEASKIDVGDASTLRMLNARYQGVDEKNRPYLVTAEVATQNPGNRNLVTLEQPKGDMTLESGAWVSLSADRGAYDNEARMLDLAGHVRLFHDSGYVFETEAAEVDLGLGRAGGSAPVEGQGPDGHIAAEGFEVTEKGATIVFKGKSRLVLTPPAETAK